MTPMARAAARLVARSCEAQGLPLRVENAATLARIARIANGHDFERMSEILPRVLANLPAQEGPKVGGQEREAQRPRRQAG
jgi:hypothetical protein